MEKLSVSEAETGRLHLELAAARTAAADKEASMIAESYLWMSFLGPTVPEVHAGGLFSFSHPLVLSFFFPMFA